MHASNEMTQILSVPSGMILIRILYGSQRNFICIHESMVRLYCNMRNGNTYAC